MKGDFFHTFFLITTFKIHFDKVIHTVQATAMLA